MTSRDLGSIHTLEIALGTHFYAQHGTKTIPVFLSADGEASWSLLPSLVLFPSGGTVQPKNTSSCIFKVTAQIWEIQKRISINTNHSYHHRSPPEVIFNSSNDLTNPAEKDEVNVMKLRMIKYLPRHLFLL